MTSDTFPLGSRYRSVGTTEHRRADGSTVVHLKRRFVPQPERFDLIQEHRVEEGERLDVIAHHHLGAGDQAWRLCDANGAMRPEELTGTVGRVLRITLPEGIPGPGDA